MTTARDRTANAEREAAMSLDAQLAAHAVAAAGDAIITLDPSRDAS
jgi:hypothetical protein